MKSSQLHSSSMEDAGVEHMQVSINGINMHYAKKGTGPIILLLHGFPNLWCSWLPQIHSLAAAGYTAVAPDLRGYGDTTSPPHTSSYSYNHLVGDVVSLIMHLGGEQRVHLVGHDWGAVVGWNICLFRPEIVKGFLCLSVPFRPRDPTTSPLTTMRALYGDDYYICRFQEVGEMKREIEKYGVRKVLAKLINGREKGNSIIVMGKKNPFGIDVEAAITLPPWFSEDYMNYYEEKFSNSGFTGAFNYYRALDLNWELTAPWMGAEVKVRSRFVVGDMDPTMTTPMWKEYVDGGGLKRAVPLLDEVVIVKGAGHFITLEKPYEVTSHILDFVKNK